MSLVLVTGASGFLGTHTVAALLAQGHRVRAFVRTPAKLDSALAPLGHSAADVEVAAGDMTDHDAAVRACVGIDAAVHAAATYSFRRRDAAAMLNDNASGTESVLTAALDGGARHVVHVSSTVALNTRGGAVISHRSPVGPGHGPYSRSKVASEHIARRMQDEGRAVSIVNPGGIIGPHDPYLGESDEIIALILKGQLPTWPKGALQWVDVRDVAAVIVAALAHEPGGRYPIPGDTLTLPHASLREVTGRRLPSIRVPASIATLATMPGYLTGWSFLPGAVEGTRITACGNPVDHSHTSQVLGVRARPLHDSLTDTVRWLAAAGHITAKQAGAAVG